MPHPDAALNRTADLIRLATIDGAGDAAAPHKLDERSLQRGLELPRQTIRSALGALVDQGFLDRRPGVGTSTVHETAQTPASLPAVGLSMEAQHGRGRLRPVVLAWETTPATPALARRLTGVAPGDAVLCIDYRLESEDGAVLGVYTNYLREREAKAADPGLLTSDFYAFLDAIGADMQTCDFVFSCVAADANLAALIEVVAGTPVLRFEQSIRNGAGEVFDFAFGSNLPSARFEVNAIPREA